MIIAPLYDIVEPIIWRIFHRRRKKEGWKTLTHGKCSFFGDDSFLAGVTIALRDLAVLDPVMFKELETVQITLIHRLGAFRYNWGVRYRFGLPLWAYTLGTNGFIAYMGFACEISKELRGMKWWDRRIIGRFPVDGTSRGIEWVRRHKVADDALPILDDHLMRVGGSKPAKDPL